MVNRKHLSIVLLLSLGMPQVQAQDEPDTNKEARFHRIYKSYNEQPTSEESWSKALGERSVQTYSVQSGDTLWDISETFFGDPQYWPKVWSLNKGSILNPHDIGSNMSISFFPGSSAEAPAMNLAQNSDVADPVIAAQDKSMPAAATTSAGSAAAGDAVPAAKKRKGASVLKKLPPSLPSLDFGGIQTKRISVEVATPPKVFPQPISYLNYYIQDTPVAGVGEVIETEMDLKSAMDFQYVLVKFNSGTTPEKNYMVQKNRGPVVDNFKGDRKAHVVEVQGSVQILERVNDSEPIYRAMVSKAIEQVEVGGILVPGQIPRIDTSVGSVSSGASARIIGGQFSNERKMFGTNSLVFLDAGSGQGLQEGQTVQVFADQRLRNEKTLSLTNDRPIGLIKIVRMTPNYATAYVLRSEMEFIRGDYVGHSPSQSTKQSSLSSDGGGSSSSHTDDFNDFDMNTAPSSPSAPADSNPDFGGDDLDLQL